MMGGDSIQHDVDPDIDRPIMLHPFATTVTNTDQDLSQKNMYPKQGEYEAIQKKLEALKNVSFFLP